MISRILFTLVLAMGLFSRAEAVSGLSCDYNIQGGDYFPWRDGEMKIAPLPLAWNEIQGVWTINSDSSVYLKARVLNTNKNRKLLNISIMSKDSCSTPIASGSGYVDSTEQNVIRAVLTDTVYRYQLKLGMFNSSDLKMDSANCGDSIWAATVKMIGTTPESGLPFIGDKKTATTHNMMLKKISSDLNAICKKSPERK